MVPRMYDLGHFWGRFRGVRLGLCSRKFVWHELLYALCDVPVNLKLVWDGTSNYDLAHFLASFRGPLGVQTRIRGSRQTFIFAYAGLDSVCLRAQMLVPRSYDQSALGCRSKGQEGNGNGGKGREKEEGKERESKGRGGVFPSE